MTMVLALKVAWGTWQWYLGWALLLVLVLALWHTRGKRPNCREPGCLEESTLSYSYCEEHVTEHVTDAERKQDRLDFAKGCGLLFLLPWVGIIAACGLALELELGGGTAMAWMCAWGVASKAAHPECSKKDRLLLLVARWKIVDISAYLRARTQRH